MSKNEKLPPKKPALNPYWLYGAIALFFLGMSFFGDSDGIGDNQR